jgi:four helix bundle protein
MNPVQQNAPQAPAVPAPVGDPVADFRKLDCYDVALRFQAVVQRVLPSCTSVLRDQLERASLSVLANLAESCGRRSRRDKARFVAIARGSAFESAAILDVLYLRGGITAADYRQGQRLMTRTAQMLTRLQAKLGG